ncbi:MAG TPA: prolyl oligopeptidase family serine peptidase [Streptosporangiaceae bacterium]|nr:prolyl oligopeptidase family serine peptidase [Streptosporangiaceae bacterium]
MTPATPVTADDVLASYAASRRFALGRPRDLTLVPEDRRLVFLRALAADNPATALWSLDLETGTERLLADPLALLNGAAEQIPAAELRRRERSRESARGIVAYSTDSAGRIAVFALSGRLFACDLVAGQTREVPVPGTCVDPQIDPTGSAIGYLDDRALRVVGLDGAAITALSDDDPEVSYGAADFAAAEELSRQHGFWWSPDGRQLLVARVDTRDMTTCWLGDPTYNEREPFRQPYPRAGFANAVVRLVLAGLDGSTTPVAGAPDERLPYLESVSWQEGHGPTIALLARGNQLSEIRTVDPATGQTALVRADTDHAWLQLMPGTPRWLPDGRLLRSAVCDDTYRLFAGDEPVTPAGLQVSAVISAGPRTIFRATTEATEQHLHALDLATGHIERLTSEPGVHGGVAGGELLAISSETLDTDGITVRVYSGGTLLATTGSLPREPAFAPAVTLLRSGQRELRTAVLFPREGLRPAGPLPVLMAPYGGAAQQVLKARRLFNEPQWLADQGFAVVVADGRGSPGRGPGWERAFYLDVATPPLDDQVAALESVINTYPGELDAGRVGIRGWSFGGYLSALAVLRRPDVFHAAVAGAPVSDWRYYDTAATERWLGHPDEHPDAYDRTSLLPLASGLSRPLLLIHGLADDNVHPRHSLLLSEELLAASRPHEVLMLPGVTHMVWQPPVMAGMLRAQAEFFRRYLSPPGLASGSAPGLASGSAG